MANFCCPICGAELRVEAQGGNWKRQEWNSYGVDPSSGPLEAGASWYRREPARPPTSADVGVPAAWAGLTGVALSFLSIPLTVWVEWPWWAPLAVLGGGTGLTWLVLLIRWQGLLWRIEEIIGADIDGDKVQGRPGVVRVELTEPEKKSMRFIDLPVSDEQIRRVSMAVLLNGATFTRRGLADVISDGDYRMLSAVMINAGLLRYKDDKPQLGCELTHAGRAVLAHYLNH